MQMWIDAEGTLEFFRNIKYSCSVAVKYGTMFVLNRAINLTRDKIWIIRDYQND